MRVAIHRGMHHCCRYQTLKSSILLTWGLLVLQRQLFAAAAGELGDGRVSFAWSPRSNFLAAAGNKVRMDDRLCKHPVLAGAIMCCHTLNAAAYANAGTPAWRALPSNHGVSFQLCAVFVFAWTQHRGSWWSMIVMASWSRSCTCHRLRSPLQIPSRAAACSCK